MDKTMDNILVYTPVMINKINPSCIDYNFCTV